MRAVSHLWWVLIAGCSGGGGGTTTPADGGATTSGDDACRFTTTVSGGLEASLTGESAVCAYTSRGVSLTEIGGGSVVVAMTFDDLDPNETGTVDARIDVTQKSDRWTGAKCSITVTSNTLVKAKSGDDPFDQYLIKGTGTCSSSATYRSDAGAKGPVDIAPFTFSLRTLFY